VLTDEAIRQKLYPFAWGARNSLDTASRFVILLARKKVDTLYSAEFIAHMMRDIHHLPPEAVHQRRERYRLFQEDDFELLESDRALFDWRAADLYRACQHADRRRVSRHRLLPDRRVSPAKSRRAACRGGD
jgi:nitroreductase